MTGRVELTDSRDAEVRKHNDYSGVVLWLLCAEGPTPLAAAKRVEMIQKDKRFTPHVLAIPLGSTVEFPNFDPIFHSAFSNFSGQPFDVGLYPPGSSKSVTFRHSGIVRVFCNIHPTMSAIIAVLRTPWYTVTPSSGRFSVTGVPPGDYQLHVFHERAREENLKSLGQRISVPVAGLALPPIRISEQGFTPRPHKNKFGRDYPPVPNDGTYPGAPQ
ncbi:MAG TPA: carboxypeptidase regulatory-like domain-containing protein [Bryobacteraceae bacterium]|nr:carboxypeptidase regulatory-like domain-containing protein [Bryobacteraceae bacterium]